MIKNVKIRILIFLTILILVISLNEIQKILGLSQNYPALFASDISGSDKQKFIDFIDAHESEIVYIKAWAEYYNTKNENETLQEHSGSWNGYTLSMKSPECSKNEMCGGQSYNFILQRSGESNSIYITNGIYIIDGFFLVSPIAGVHQGWVETAIEELNRADVILKMGSPPKSEPLLTFIKNFITKPFNKNSQVLDSAKDNVRENINIKDGLEEITVEGRNFITREDLFLALELEKGMSLVDYDTIAAENRVKKISGVEEVKITIKNKRNVHVFIKESTSEITQ